MRKISVSSIKTLISFVVSGSCLLLGVFMNSWFFVTTAVSLIWAFHSPKGSVMLFGPLYWLRSDDKRKFACGFGTMHTTTSPWRYGRGVYVSLLGKLFHIGACYRLDIEEESEGLLSAVRGRYLDVTPNEIGEWNAVQKRDQDSARAS